MLAMVLGASALPTMAAQDCWTLWNTNDPVSQYAGLPALRAASQNCSATVAEVASVVWAEVVPQVSKTTKDDRGTRVDVMMPGSCAVTGEQNATRYTIATCRYTIRSVYTYDVAGIPPLDTTVQGNFQTLMQCGEKLGTTATGATPSTCKRIVDRVPSSKPCDCVNNPIEPLSGLKRQPEDLFTWGRGHKLSLTYWSKPNGASRVDEGGANSFGRSWFSNLHRQMLTEFDQDYFYLFQRGSGVWKAHSRSGAAPDPSEQDPKPWATSQYWLYRDVGAGAIESYRFDGSLASIAYADGRRLDFTTALSAPNSPKGSSKFLVASISDEAGRRISFNYADTADYQYASISSVVDPAGVSLPIAYNAQGNLSAITYADQTKRQFLYEDGARPQLLTGVIDESASRIGTYAYDADGRVKSSQTGSLTPWSVTWTTPPVMGPREVYDAAKGIVFREAVQLQPSTATVTAPDGRQSVWGGTVAGRAVLTGSRSQQAGSGSAAAVSTGVFDAAGNETQRDDLNGNRSCASFDTTRNLALTRVEGLTSATACASVVSGALPAGARKTSSQWHPDWRLTTKTAEPLLRTTFVYNGQPDPFNGNVVASCAPADAKLPDNKPIVVLCKRVEQATTDETGALGFNAVLQAGVPVRTASWTYDAIGRMLTERDALNQVVVTNEYYADTTADHTRGDLMRSTNAAGHVTQFTRYDAYGKVLEMVDANSAVTTYTYDLRQRLTSTTTNGDVTGYEYWPTGLLKKSTLPDGSTVNYEYDDAHRMVAVSDSLGNRVDYTLDQSGNRTGETAKDPQGTLKRTMNRAFDALGRAQQTTGRD